MPNGVQPLVIKVQFSNYFKNISYKRSLAEKRFTKKSKEYQKLRINRIKIHSNSNL